MTNKTTATVCKFLIEDVVCRYGCVGKIVADRGKLDAEEAKELFDRLGVKLTLTTAYNLEANAKVEQGHGPIVKAIVCACEGRVGNWLRLLPYGLWADRTTHNSVTRYMLVELMFGQKPIMPVERTITQGNDPRGHTLSYPMYVTICFFKYLCVVLSFLTSIRTFY